MAMAADNCGGKPVTIGLTMGASATSGSGGSGDRGVRGSGGSGDRGVRGGRVLLHTKHIACGSTVSKSFCRLVVSQSVHLSFVVQHSVQL